MNPSGQERISLYVGSMEGGKGCEWRRDAVINGSREQASVSACRLKQSRWLRENVLITYVTVIFFHSLWFREAKFEEIRFESQRFKVTFDFD